MQFRRSFALTTAALALATTGLSSCGFDYATDRYYTPSTGTNDVDGTVKVLAAVVVSAEPGSGTFIASFSNTDLDATASLTELSVGAETPIEFEPVLISEGGLVNLAEPPVGLKLTGEFEAGDFVEVAIGFDTGERVVLDVPVVDNAGYYEGLDNPAPTEEVVD